MKRFAICSTAMLLAISTPYGCSSSSASVSTASPSSEPAVYTASAKGFGGDVTVTVTVQDGKVLSASAEGPDETEGKGSLAIDAFNSGDSGVKEGTAIKDLKIDNVSGATVTSTALQNAITDIVRQASGTAASEKTSLTPGTYTETVYGNNYSRPF